MKLIILFTMFFIVDVMNVMSQHLYTSRDFNRYAQSDGLLDNSIYSILQDSMGYIWCGTENGLARFNGNSFRSYTSESQEKLIQGNYVEKLKLNERNIFVLTRNGLSKLNPKSLIAQPIKLSSIMPDEFTNYVTDVEQLKDGVLAICSNTGFYVLDKNKQQRFSHTDFTSKDIGNKRIYYGIDIIKLNETEILIYVQDHKLFHYNSKTNSFRQIDSTAKSLAALLPWPLDWTIKRKISDHEVLMISLLYKTCRYINLKSGIVKNQNLPPFINDLWWASKIVHLRNNKFALTCVNSGFYTFDLDTTSVFIHFQNHKHLSDYRCFDIYTLKDMRLAIGTDKGLLIQKDSNQFITAYDLKKLSNNQNNLFISALLPIKDKLLIASYNETNNLIVFNLKTNKILESHTIGKNIENFDGIQQIDTIDSNNLYLNTNRGLFIYNLKSKKLDPVFPELAQDIIMPLNRSKNYIHFLSYSDGQIYKYNKKSRITTKLDSTTNRFTKLKTIFKYDNDDNLWIVSNSIAKISRSDDFNIVKDKNRRALNDKYYFIDFYKDTMILGNQKGELEFFNTKNKRSIFYNYHPLKRNIIVKGDVYKHNLLFSAGNSIYSCNMLGHKFRDLSLLANFPEERITCNNFILKEDSTAVFAASTNHLLKIALQDVENIQVAPIISAIHIGDKRYHHPSAIFDLNYNEQAVEIYTSLLYYSSEKIKSYYKIDENDWIEFNEVIRINDIDFGTHKISLRYETPVQQSRITQYVINFRPPFYKSFYFNFTIALLISSLIYLELKRRMKIAARMSNLNHQLTESEIKALRSQMNPHFIFNCLNSIKGLILDNKNQKASIYLSKFADLVRKNLTQSQKNFITIQEQMDYIGQYLELEQLRFENIIYHLICQQDIDMHNELIPTMLIQPLIENAIWHGKEAKTGIPNLNLFIKKEKQFTIFEIEDFGDGIHAEKVLNTNGNSIALENIRQRINLYNEKYNINCKLIFTDKSLSNRGKGTTVTLSYQSFN